MTTVLHDREVASRFDVLTERFKREVSAEDYRLRATSQALEAFDRPVVLDLGCGKGRFARHLLRSGATVVGLDLSVAMLAEADGLNRVKGSAASLPFPNAMFDAVVAIETLEHVSDVPGVIREAARVLSPQGRLVILDKNAASLNARRPWLPSLVVKRIDERRGLWMYPVDGPVRERWFFTRALRTELSRHFASVSISHPISPDESNRRLFRAIPAARLMTCWTADSPRGKA